MTIDTEFNVGDSVCYLSGDDICYSTISTRLFRLKQPL